jgi:hypothetical protein
VTAAESHAIVVGIENYRLPGLSLTGPVEDALKVAEWLQSSGMPRDRLHLFLAPLKGELPEGARPATYAEFDKFRTEELKKLKGDLLYVFWGGHGYLSRDHDRVLFWSDTTEAALDRHLDFNGFLRGLRDAQFPVQIGIVDACAESWDRKRQYYDLGRTQWSGPLDVGKSTVEQSFLFAAAEGKTTPNAPGERLTPQLLADMASLFDETKQWPPDPDNVFARMCNRFQGKGKRPVRYQYQSLAGDLTEYDGRLGVEINLKRLRAIAESQRFAPRFLKDFLSEAWEIHPASDLLTEFDQNRGDEQSARWIASLAKAAGRGEAELQFAFRRAKTLSNASLLLGPLNISPEKYRELHSLTQAQMRAGAAEALPSLNDMLADLWDYGANPNGEGDYAFWMFLSRVQREEPLKALQDCIDAGGKNWRARIEAALDEEERKLREQSRHFLLICIDPKSEDSSQPALLQGWLIGAVQRSPWRYPVSDWTAAKAAVAKIIGEARKALRRDGQTPSEMWVELATSMRSLDIDYERIEIHLNDYDDAKALAELHPVLLRWRDRLFHSDDFDYDDHWVVAGKRLRKATALACEFLSVEDRLDKCRNHIGLISLDFIPDSDDKRTKRSRLVSSGAPLVRWRRAEPLDTEQQRQGLATRVRQSGGATLDQLLYELGKQPGEALFWDDPERTFDPGQFNLAEITTGK